MSYKSSVYFKAYVLLDKLPQLESLFLSDISGAKDLHTGIAYDSSNLVKAINENILFLEGDLTCQCLTWFIVLSKNTLTEIDRPPTVSPLIHASHGGGL